MSNLSVKHISSLNSLEILAKQIVEGFVTGMHKSPFHGFSVEFAEHRLYNKGESTRHIDWKLFAKTDKLYVKQYAEETNLRCHIIVDNSSSMHYPIVDHFSIDNLNKINYSVLASAALFEILKKQRDAVGLSIYSNELEYFSPEKGSDSHRRMLLSELEKITLRNPLLQPTDTFKALHEIAEKLHRRSLVFLFTDMFQSDAKKEDLFNALRHLKHKKHEVVLFHTYDSVFEKNLNFDKNAKRFVDVETGEKVDLFVDSIKEYYQNNIEKYFKELKIKCVQYKIDYVPLDIQEGFEKVLISYLIKRTKVS